MVPPTRVVTQADVPGAPLVPGVKNTVRVHVVEAGTVVHLEKLVVDLSLEPTPAPHWSRHHRVIPK